MIDINSNLSEREQEVKDIISNPSDKFRDEKLELMLASYYEHLKYAEELYRIKSPKALRIMDAANNIAEEIKKLYPEFVKKH
jgi:hypothetical protein